MRRHIAPSDLHGIRPSIREKFLSWLQEDEPRRVHEMWINEDGTVTVLLFVEDGDGRTWVNGDHVMSTTRTYRPQRPCPVEVGDVVDP